MPHSKFSILENIHSQPNCPICGGSTIVLDCIDFSKGFPKSGMPVYYNSCDDCDFCFSPEMCQWTPEQFGKYVYNDDYIKIDPAYLYERPLDNSEKIIGRFDRHKDKIRHLDYGGGEGVLVQILRDNGFNSTSYDPFVNIDVNIEDLGKFDLITSFEVFEHVPNPLELMDTLIKLRKSNGMIYFSTEVSDGNISKNQRLTWWYAAPRAGHISLFSKKSLLYLAKQYNLNLGIVGEGRWIMWDRIPDWARGTIL